MATAAKKSVNKAPVAPTRRPTAVRITEGATSADLVEASGDVKITLAAAEPEGEKVTVIVPNGFTLTRDGHVPKVYAAGVQEMLVDDAAHWYTRACGVKVYEAGG